MPPALIRARVRAQLRKRQLLLWLALVSFMLGAVDFAFPLDFALRTARNKMRAQPVSGQTVVVGIDDKSETAVAPWPWNRRHLADLTDKLFDAGASRVFLDVYLGPGEAAGDRLLAQSIARHRGHVFVASGIDSAGRSEGGELVLPMPQIAAVAETVSETKWAEFWNGVLTVEYAKIIGGKPRRSMESAISGVAGNVGERFPIDYSLQVSTTPYVSAQDVLDGRARAVKGKTVIVGLNPTPVAERVFVPGQPRAARPFIVALGAETLMRGKPVVVGWMPAWLIALVASAGALYARRTAVSRAVGLAGIAFLAFSPIALERFNIYADVAIGLLMLGAAMGISAWKNFGARKRSQGATNPISGLPTAAAVLHGDQADPGSLIAVRVRHFTDLVSALPPHYEQDLIKQIVNRLSLGADGAQLLHGDDGNFFWIARSLEPAAAIDQFKALQLIFRQPIRVSEKAFDVDVAFGLDKEIQMPLSHRLASALAAAHAASQQGIGWKVHDPVSAGAKEWTLTLMGELDEAIENGHIWVAYQPKMSLSSREIIGAEALVRWTHATRGPINPAELVDVAERHGRIGKITAFVLDQAARAVKDMRTWNPDFTVSVNISPSELTDRKLLDMVGMILHRYAIPAQSLILEVTETAALAEGDVAQNVMEDLREMGVGLSIDDYGTGMSTLEYMRRVPASEVKVDRRFATALASNAADQAVVRSTIELAHTLGMKVVVEGIETAETLFMLSAMGCDIGQGYHIGRPMDASALVEMIHPEQRAALKA
jgi:EAL domain-containing protein (putative c-di-GMP-specific phosphodiesterase class I)/CHASE2 domain-containing sensor protein